MGHLLFWKLSAIALSFSAGADMATSRGQVELNPIMAQHGQFTGRSIAVGSLITGGALVAEWLVLRRHPESGKVFAVVNLGMTGAHATVAVRNGGTR